MRHIIVGPDNHGVTRYATQLAEATGSDNGSPHITFTDHLFGDTPDEAAENVLARVGGEPFSISFHDIPQPEEGADRFARRAPAYRRLAERATCAVVNSEHEAAFFDSPVRVIRLPIPQISLPDVDMIERSVGILGFLYPGKGHEDLIAALGGDYPLRFLGSVSAGHEKWARGLAEHAEITGWLTDDELAYEMARTEIPVCAHRHFSASGSLMTWLGAGRNVLASDTAYTREIDRWLPGRITLVDGDWRGAVDKFEPKVLEPPRYGWAEVAEAWKKEWAACGLM